ncbi:MAG: DUF5107 domain-containing protein [Clostridia bacterium]|nr:DUF5107 domain-containing protein [Clostridia bacterium]
MSVVMKRERRVLPTYVPGEPNELPFFIEKKAYQGATGRVYPLPYTDRLGDRAEDVEYDMITLSNEYIEAQLLPALGGKIHGAVHRSSGYEFIYRNVCIKPALIGLAGPWVSGGVEFNWPQHHRPTTFMPVEATLKENADGSKTCWMGEAEPFHRMRASVGITVYPGSSILEARCVVSNRTDAPLPFMWWNNLAVRVHSGYKAVFPPDVEWGCDHDRRAVISFPVMKGVFHTARPYDYGEGKDVTWYSNVSLPTSVMVMRGQSDMDFLGGYDFRADAGTVTVSDHHFSPGKKMWTWGDCNFGHAWCRNLTDNEDRYIELMTGVYTDNQPDFSYIMPGETKIFATVWYPVTRIGPVSNATREAALSFEVKGGLLRLGVCTTSRREDARLTVLNEGGEIWGQKCSPDPDNPVLYDVPLPDGIQPGVLEARLCSREGEELVSFRPPRKGRPKPQPRTIPPRPQDVESIEALCLHGAHLEQYKHHTFAPEDYYREALRRDENDLRANLGLGRIMLEKADFESARVHLERAVKRLTMRNDNPADPEAIYQLARLCLLEGRTDEAYSLFARAAWQYAWRSACLYEMACIDVKRGNRLSAVRRLGDTLVTNAHHLAARTLLGYITGDAAQLHSVLEILPQDSFARYALWLLGEGEVPAFSAGRAQDVIDAALDFLHAGLRGEAAKVLSTCTVPDQMTACYLAFATDGVFREGNMKYCFPNRLEDIAVLSLFPDRWQAQYLLGCLYYDRMNYVAARDAWEACVRLAPECYAAWRNLAQALYDHFGEKIRAKECLKKAHKLAPDDPRIVYELLQLYKNLDVSPSERLAFLEKNKAQAAARDDCSLDRITLYVQQGELRRAQELLSSRRFHIYEGGEGRLTRLHGWIYTLCAQREFEAGHAEAALRSLQSALVFPDNYGEGRHYSAQEAHIFWYTGLVREVMGETAEARACWQRAAGQPGGITEMSYFAALAQEKLGEKDASRALLEEMLATAQKLKEHAGEYGYFGVGMPAPLPYELDGTRAHLAQAALMTALACKGLGREDESRAAVREIKAADLWNEKLSCFGHLGIL